MFSMLSISYLVIAILLSIRHCLFCPYIADLYYQLEIFLKKIVSSFKRESGDIYEINHLSPCN